MKVTVRSGQCGVVMKEDKASSPITRFEPSTLVAGVEDVIGCVRHECLAVDVGQLVTAGRGCHTPTVFTR